MAETILGTDGNTDVAISLWDRKQGCYIIGANGTGKSVLIENMVAQDIAEGLGVCVLDPHGDLTNAIINRIPEERIKDVILLDPLDTDFPFPLNLFYCLDSSDPKLLQLTIEQIEAVFRKVWGASADTPRLNQYVRNIARVFIPKKYTIIEVPKFLRNKSSFREQVLEELSPKIQEFWLEYNDLSDNEKEKRRESTLDRVDTIVGSEILYYILGQATTLNFREIMDTQKILLVKLSSHYEQMTSLLGSIIIGQLLLAALSRSELAQKKRRQFNLYAYEFQRFSTPAMAQLLSEARKYAIATTIAHQYRDQLDEANKGGTLQSGSKIFFRLTSVDSAELAGELDHTPPPGDLIERPVRIPTQSVIRHLLEKGHENQEVNNLFNRYLRPIHDHPVNSLQNTSYWTRRAGTYEKWKNKPLRYITFSGLWQRAETPLNRFLVQRMEGSLKCTNEAYKQSLLGVILTLYDYFPFEIEIVDEPCLTTGGTISSGMTSLTISGANVPELRKINEDIFQLIVEHDCTTDMDKRIDLVLELIGKRTGIWKHIVNDQNTAESKASWECHEVMNFCAGVGYLGYLLSKSPILVDSGKYEKVEGPQRTYNDMQNAIANDLVSLPKGTAMVKTPQGEWKIATHLGKGLDGDFKRKKDILIKNTRDRYCKSRQEVEQEIAERIKPDDNPPPTKRKHTLS